MTEQLSKKNPRQRWPALRALKKGGDLVGVGPDEHDRLMGPPMRRSESGQSSGQLARFLGEQLSDYFGLDGARGITDCSSKPEASYSANWSGTVV